MHREKASDSEPEHTHNEKCKTKSASTQHYAETSIVSSLNIKVGGNQEHTSRSCSVTCAKGRGVSALTWLTASSSSAPCLAALRGDR